MAVYTAIEFNKDSNGKEVQGTFTTIIDSAHYTEIEALVEEIDIASLKDNYTVDQTDNPTAILVITYDGGKIKTVKDYGMQGTFKLQELYNLLSNLRLSQNWH